MAVVGRPNPGGSRIKRWWLYDVVRDTARLLRVHEQPGCALRNVAVWRDRLAYVEQCRLAWSRVILRDARGVRRLIRISGGLARLLLRHRSLLVVGGGGLDVDGDASDDNLTRVLDHGHRCPAIIAAVVEERGIWAGLGSSTLTWVTADYEFDGMTYSGVEIRDIDFSGRCQASPRVRETPSTLVPQTPINANGPLGYNGVPKAGVAIDGRTVYYVTDTAIHRLRLPAHGAPMATLEQAQQSCCHAIGWEPAR